MSRNRIIYQSEALFNSLITGVSATADITTGTVANLQRVTEISTNSEITRTDVNVFGKLAALSREIIEEPTVSMDFTYYLADGFNETVLGLSVCGTGTFTLESGLGGSTVYQGQLRNCLSGILANQADAQKNYYILTVEEGVDANGISPISADYVGKLGIIGLGNCFLSNYTVNAAVGEIPTANVSVDASNITFALSATAGIENPAINVAIANPTQYNSKVLLPYATTGTLGVKVLRPGDITIDFGAANLDMGGAVLPGMTSASSKQSAHIQNFSLEVPLTRTPQNRIGNAFSFSKELDVPINVTLNVSANLADLDEGSLQDLVCAGSAERTIKIKMFDPCEAGSSQANMLFELRGATLDSQNMSSTIGDNKTVDLVFTSQIGGPNDQTKGLFISGRL